MISLLSVSFSWNLFMQKPISLLSRKEKRFFEKVEEFNGENKVEDIGEEKVVSEEVFSKLE